MAAIRQDLILDMRGALAQIQTLEKELADLRKPVDIPIDIKGDAVAEVKAIDQRLDEMEQGASEVNRELSEMALAAGHAVTDFSRLARELDVSEDEARSLSREILEARGNSLRTADAAREVARAMGLSEQEASQFAQEVDRARQKVDQLGNSTSGVSKLEAGFKKLALAAAAFVGVQQLASFVTGAIKQFSNLQESTSKAEVVFGDFADTVLNFTANAPEQLGSTSAAALEAASSVGNLFLSIGFGQEAAAGMSTQIVQLGTDLASFNNISVDEALEKLRSGLVGETEPLRTLGVLLSEAAVNAKGFELGLGGVTGKLSESEKVQARFAIIMEQTATAQGDFARTSDGLANSQRSVTAAFQEFQARVGEALAPLFSSLLDQVPAVIASLDKLIPPLIQLADALADMSVIFGPIIGFFVEVQAKATTLTAAIVQSIGNIFSAAGEGNFGEILQLKVTLEQVADAVAAGEKPARAFGAGLVQVANNGRLTTAALHELADASTATALEQAAALRIIMDNPGDATTEELIILRNALVDLEEQLRGASEANRDYQFIAATLASSVSEGSGAILSQATVLTLLRQEADLLGVSLEELVFDGGAEKFPELAGLIGQLAPATASLGAASDNLAAFALTFEDTNVRITDSINELGLLPEALNITAKKFVDNLEISAADEAKFQLQIAELFVIDEDLAARLATDPRNRDLVADFIRKPIEAVRAGDIIRGEAEDLTGDLAEKIQTAIEDSDLDLAGIAALELIFEGMGNTVITEAGIAALGVKLQEELNKLKLVIPPPSFSFGDGEIPFGGGVVGNGTVGGGTPSGVTIYNNFTGPVQDAPTQVAQATQSIGAAAATFNRIGGT